MMKRAASLLALCLALSVPLAAQGARDLLAASDATLFGERGRWTMGIQDFEGGALKRSYRFSCLAGGADRFLLVAEDPPVLRGQTIMRLKETIYHYIKKVDKLEQVAASVAFFNSSFSMEDVVSTRLSEFYEVGAASRVVLDGRPCLSLTLSAKSRSVAYRSIVCWLDEASLRPLRREYYAYSGKLLKTLVFEEQRNAPSGSLVFLRLTMHDALRPSLNSRIEFSAFDYATPVGEDTFTIPAMKRAAR